MIDGIGGAFLFSNDVKKLSQWYRDVMGIAVQGEDEECKSVYTSFDYRSIDNPEIKRSIAWSIMTTKADIKGKPRTGKINYTVKDMATFLDQLRSKGATIDKSQEYPGMGKFAWLKDPEGNEIELWEPEEERV